MLAGRRLCRRDEGGFTLLEIMIVVAIISILAVIGIPNILQAQKVANEKKAIQTIRAIYAAQQDHLRKFDRYASSLSELVAAKLLIEPFYVGMNQIQPNGMWEFMTGIPDPSTNTVSITAEANRKTRFRIAAQPRGTSMADRMRICDKMYFMTESGMLYTHRVSGGCNLSHASSSVISLPDSYFGTYYPATDGT